MNARREQLVSDKQLARMAARGDGAAFAELAERYEGTLYNALRGRPPFCDAEEERQEALLGLFEACRYEASGKGRGGGFPGLAARLIRHRVIGVRRRARLRKHRVLTDALSLDAPVAGAEAPLGGLIPAGERWDPAVVVEQREELARLAVEGQLRPEPRRPRSKPYRFYSEDEIATALQLVAEGKTTREAGAAIGATHVSVLRWMREAA